MSVIRIEGNCHMWLFFGPRRWLAAVLVLLVASARPDTLAAQAPPGPKAQPLKKEESVGQIADIGPGMLQLRLPAGGNLWQAMPAPNAKIEVTGKASREMLQPKQFISCAVTLDELGKVTEPAMKVLFFDSGTPGVIAGGLGLAEPGAKRVANRRPAGSYTINGPIKQVEGDIVTIQIGKERFDITVPPEADLAVNSSNVSIASRGDMVEAEGSFYQRGQLLVSSLKITLANPLTPPPPKNKALRKPAAAAP